MQNLFLVDTRKSSATIIQEGKQRFLMLKKVRSRNAPLLIGSEQDEYSLALVSQAYQAYMSDLRRGKHIGTQVEMAIWLYCPIN